MGYGKVQIPTVGGRLIRPTFKRTHLTKSDIQQHPNTIINHSPMEFMLPISPHYSNGSQGVWVTLADFLFRDVEVWQF